MGAGVIVDDSLRQRILDHIVENDGPDTCVHIADALGYDVQIMNSALRALHESGQLSLSFTDDQVRQYDIPETAPDGRPGFKDLDYAGVEERILESIDELYCTAPQIKRHAGFGPRDDMSDVIEGMLLEDKIVQVDNDTIVGFFRTGKVPTRFWTQGDKCGAEWPAGREPAPTNGRRKKRSSKPIDGEKLEELAATCRNQKEIAEALGISDAWLQLCMKGEGNELRAKYEAGIARNPLKQKSAPVPREVPAAPIEERAEPVQPEETPEPDELGIEPERVEEAMKDAAVDEFLDQFATAKDVVNEETEPPAAAANGNHPKPLLDRLEEVKAAGENVHERVVEFKTGGAVVIAYEGNIFHTTRAEREFIGDLTDIFDDWQDDDTLFCEPDVDMYLHPQSRLSRIMAWIRRRF